MKTLDLNSDLGESMGLYKIGMDESMLSIVTSANIACGFHGGDPVVMRQTVKTAIENGVSIGAHPGYPDLLGFGRRQMSLSPDEAYSYILYQLGALNAFVRAQGGEIAHIKPHGAMYNTGCKDISLATAICSAASDFDKNIIVLAPVGSCFEQAASSLGLQFVGEFFADRAYNSDGSLVARSIDGAVIEDESLAAQRVVQMAKQGTVKCIDGSVIPISCGSVCVHGDNAHAVKLAQTIRETLTQNGIAVQSIRGQA